LIGIICYFLLRTHLSSQGYQFRWSQHVQVGRCNASRGGPGSRRSRRLAPSWPRWSSSQLPAVAEMFAVVFATAVRIYPD